MKLILKLPKDKPPFIGILLSAGDNRSYPERLNESLIVEHKYARYRIELEFLNAQLNLLLISDESKILKRYDGLVYAADQLTHWVYQTRSSKAFNFGHLLLEKNKEVVLRTWGKKLLYVLSVERYAVVCSSG